MNEKWSQSYINASQQGKKVLYICLAGREKSKVAVLASKDRGEQEVEFYGGGSSALLMECRSLDMLKDKLSVLLSSYYIRLFVEDNYQTIPITLMMINALNQCGDEGKDFEFINMTQFMNECVRAGQNPLDFRSAL